VKAGYPWQFSRVPGRINRTGQDAEGKSTYIQYELGGIGTIHDLLLGSIGVIAGGGVHFETSSFTTQPFTYFLSVNEQTGFSEQSTSQLTASASNLGYSLRLGLSLRFSDAFSLASNFSYASLLSKNLGLDQAILDPSTAVYRGGGRTQAFAADDSITVGNTHSGVDALLDFKIPSIFGDRIHFGIGAYYDLTADVAASPGKAFTLATYLSLPFTIMGSAPSIIDSLPIAIIDTNTVHSGEVKIDQRASNKELPKIQLVSDNDPDHIEITRWYITHRQMLPVIPYVFFDDGSVNISKVHDLISSDEVSRFAEEGLINLSIDELLKQQLNVVAARLKRSNNSKIILKYSKRSGLRRISKQRIEVLANYLTSVWGIEAASISSKAVAMSPGEENSIIIAANDPQYLEPLLLEWRERKQQLSPLTIKKEIPPTFTGFEWNINLYRDAQLIDTFSIDNPSRQSGIELPATLLDQSDSTMVTATLTVNALDTSYSASDSIPVLLSKAKHVTDSSRYTIVLLDQNAFEQSSYLQEIKTFIERQEASDARVVLYCDPKSNSAEWARSLTKVSKGKEMPLESLDLQSEYYRDFLKNGAIVIISQP